MSQIIPHLNLPLKFKNTSILGFSNVSNYTPLKHSSDLIIRVEAIVSVMSQIIPHLNKYREYFEQAIDVSVMSQIIPHLNW